MWKTVECRYCIFRIPCVESVLGEDILVDSRMAVRRRIREGKTIRDSWIGSFCDQVLVGRERERERDMEF